MKKILLFESPITSLSGYGEHAREIASYLIKFESYFDLYFIDKTWGKSHSMFKLDNDSLHNILTKKIDTHIAENIDLYIKLGYPSEFRPIGKNNIGITALVESTLCSKDFLVGCNRMDKVIVPSQFNKTTLLDSYDHHNIKNKTSIDVIPQHISLNKIKESKTEVKQYIDNIEDEFCFLYNGKWNEDTTVDRKNVVMLISTFIYAFKDSEVKPALVLKTNHNNYSEVDFDRVTKSIKNIIGDSHVKVPNIYLLHGNLNNAEMSDLYLHDKIKCGLNFSHGESFGRPIIETILSNKPILVPKWSAPCEYITNDMFFLEGNLVNNPKVDNVYIEEGKWFDIDYQSASKKLLDVYNNYDKYLNVCFSQVKKIKDEHSNNVVFKRYKDVLDIYL